VQIGIWKKELAENAAGVFEGAATTTTGKPSGHDPDTLFAEIGSTSSFMKLSAEVRPGHFLEHFFDLVELLKPPSRSLMHDPGK